MKLVYIIFSGFFFLTDLHSQIPGNSLDIKSSGNLVLANDPAGLTVSNNMTVEAWVYVCCNMAAISAIVQKGWCGTNYGYIFVIRNQKLEWEWNLPGDPCTQISRYSSLNDVIPLNQWTHVAAVHTPSSVSLYVNGRQVSGSKIAGDYGNILNSAEPLRIGGYRLAPSNGSGLDFPLIGRVDEVRIWHTARTAIEISTNYQASLTGNENGLVAYYQLDETGSGAGIPVQNSATATSGFLNGITVGPTVAFINNNFPVVCDGNVLLTVSPKSSTICSPDSITLSANGAISYSWSPGLSLSSTTGASVKASPSTTTTYKVTGATANCSKTDSVIVIVKQKSFSIINKTICEPDQFSGHGVTGTYIDTFIAANGCDSIRTLNLIVNKVAYSTINHSICQGRSYLGHTAAGTFIDTLVAANGCDSIRTLNLVVNPKASSTINQSICQGESYLGHTTAGTFIDTLVAANGCDSIRTLILTILEKPRPDLGIDKEICIGDTLVLSPGSFLSYLWQDGTTLNYFIVRSSGLYSVIVTNHCGSNSDKIIITEKLCNESFPNAFTPNEDGKNDLFKILNAFNLKNYKLGIYNRWGQKVFETGDYLQGWDGKINGNPQNSGVYTYFCKYTKNGIAKKIKGTFILIR